MQFSAVVARAECNKGAQAARGGRTMTNFMQALIHLGVRILEAIFAIGLVGTVFVLILTGIEDLETLLERKSE